MLNAMTVMLKWRVGGRSCGSHIHREKGLANNSMLAPDVERSVDVALASGDFSSGPRLPWESCGFVRDVFDNSVPWLRPLPVPRALVAIPFTVAPKKEMTISERKDLVRTAIHSRAQRCPDPDRALVLLKWAELLLVQPELTTVGRMLLDCAGDDGAVMNTLQDIFRKRATSTMRQRSGSLGLLYGWLTAVFPEDPVLPLDESRVYAYACHVRDTRKSASRLSTLISTLKFVGNVFKVAGALECAESPRIDGVAHGQFLTKRPRLRADMLSPSMLAWLEIASFALPSPFDRAVAGYCMMCAMGRLRCSDAGRIRHASLIGRYYEGALSRTKTARSKEKATSFIPLVVPAYGVLAKPWLGEFLIARGELDLRDVPSLASLSQDFSFVIMPGYATCGCELEMPMDSVELTERLRSILASGFSADDLEHVASHSLKATLLAYMNIWGCDLTVSELLGYHVNKEHASALNYTRDSLSAPIRQLSSMLQQLHWGEFVPDAPRDLTFPPEHRRSTIFEKFKIDTGMTVDEAAVLMSGHEQPASRAHEVAERVRMERFRPEYAMPSSGLMEYLTEEEELACGVSQRDLREVEPPSPSSSSSSDSSLAELEVQAAHAMIDAYHDKAKVKQVSAKADTCRIFRHARTKVVHYGHCEHSDKTGCGRLISEAYYVIYPVHVELCFPKCKHCFGS